jgi:hypothetical protein
VAFDGAGRPVPLPYIERWEGTSTFIMGHIARRFGSARFRPVAWGGAGLMSDGGTRRGPVDLPEVPPGHILQPGDAATRAGRSVIAFTYEGGYGVDIPLRRRLTLRPFVAVRLANTSSVGPKYIIHSGGRLAFR